MTSGSKENELQEVKEENLFTSRSKEILPQEVKEMELSVFPLSFSSAEAKFLT